MIATSLLNIRNNAMEESICACNPKGCVSCQAQHHGFSQIEKTFRLYGAAVLEQVHISKLNVRIIFFQNRLELDLFVEQLKTFQGIQQGFIVPFSRNR